MHGDQLVLTLNLARNVPLVTHDLSDKCTDFEILDCGG